jgi:hypothetical protein
MPSNTTPETEETSPMTQAPAVVQGGAVALAAETDDLLAQAAGMGTQDMTQQDRVIPFLRMIQSLSPQRTRGKPEYIPGVEEGDIFNTVTGKIFKGEAGALVVPVTYQRRYTEWWPRGGEKKGLVKDWGTDASALEGSHRNERGKDITPDGTEITVSGDYFAFLLDEASGTWEPVLISMSGTQMKKARQWNTRLSNARVQAKGQLIAAPLFYHAWRMTAVPESNDDGAWMGWKIEVEKPIFEYPFGAALFKEAMSLNKKVAAGEVKTAAPGDEEIPF